MGSDPDQRSALTTYFANVHADTCAAAEYPVPDLTGFYRASRTTLFRRALALVRDHAAAEDVLQETFLRLVSEIRQGGPIRSALQWTNKVLRNVALNHIEHRYVVSSVTLEGVDLETLAAPHRSPSAEQSLISRERKGALETALAGLSGRERQCLQLFAEGSSYQRIAEEQQIPYGTAVAAIRRGLRKVRNEMAADGHE